MFRNHTHTTHTHRPQTIVKTIASLTKPSRRIESPYDPMTTDHRTQ